MKIKNTMIILIVVILIVGFGIFLIKDSKAAGDGSNSGDKVQVVKLSVINGQYVMSPSQVKMGVPVRIEANIAQMPGCSKSFVIPSFNIRKTFTSTDNTVEFTPDKAGVFNVMCSMNMYKGTFTVLQSDGSKSNYVETSSPSTTSGSGSTGGGCGMKTTGSTGGCGCMG